MNYYSQKLSANRLREVYQTEILAVSAYLDSEIAFVKERLKSYDRVLELGAGYGRVMKELAPQCRTITGIDISAANIAYGKSYLKDVPNAQLILMDAQTIGIGSFSLPYDVILCMQNALSAMKVEPYAYIRQMMELLYPGGQAYISTYCEGFWEHRLAWFGEQSAKGLLGELDLEQSKDGVIVCKDGFRSYSHTAEQLAELGSSSGYPYEIHEVAASSLFLVISKT